MPNDTTVFGRILGATMRRLGVSADELATRANVTAGGIRHLLRGFRGASYELAAKLADGLGVPLDWFRSAHVPPSAASTELWLVRSEALAELDAAGRLESISDAQPAAGVAELPAIAAGPAEAEASKPTEAPTVDAVAVADEELAFALIRLSRMEPLTAEERQLVDRYAAAQRRKGRTEGEALHAAVDRLGDVWRQPSWQKRRATIAQERRSAGKSTRGPAAKRRKPPQRAEAEAEAKVDQVVDLVDDQVDAGDKPPRRRRKKVVQ